MVKVEYKTFGDMANNCYIITDEATKESAMIDCPLYNSIMREFAREHNIKYILLTHGHYDHIGGLKDVRRITGAKIVIGEADSEMLISSKKSIAAFVGVSQNYVEPDILVNDGDKIKLGESEITVMSTPGHTKGGVCYLCDDNIFTGDVLFCLSCGRTDFPGGSDDEMLQSLKKIASLTKDYNVYPGHDMITKLSFEKENNQYLINAIKN